MNYCEYVHLMKNERGEEEKNWKRVRSNRLQSIDKKPTPPLLLSSIHLKASRQKEKKKENQDNQPRSSSSPPTSASDESSEKNDTAGPLNTLTLASSILLSAGVESSSTGCGASNLTCR